MSKRAPPGGAAQTGGKPTGKMRADKGKIGARGFGWMPPAGITGRSRPEHAGDVNGFGRHVQQRDRSTHPQTDPPRICRDAFDATFAGLCEAHDRGVYSGSRSPVDLLQITDGDEIPVKEP